jgi:hypothetical protein
LKPNLVLRFRPSFSFSLAWPELNNYVQYIAVISNLARSNNSITSYSSAN